MSIGIVTPYWPCETTAAAIRLMDLTLSLGVDCHPVTVRPIRRGLHPYWDTRIRRLRHLGDVGRWVASTDVFVWFEPHPLYTAYAVHHRPTARQTFVVPWSRLDDVGVSLAAQFPLAVVPANATLHMLKERHAGGRFRYTPWDAGVAIQPPRPAPSGAPSVFVHLDRSLTRENEGDFARALVPLCRNGRCPVTVYHEGPWSQTSRRMYEGLLAGHVRLLTTNNLCELTAEVASHDWFVDGSLRSDFSLAGLRARSLGVPVVAYRMPVTEEYLASGDRDGFLVPARLDYNVGRAPSVPSSMGLGPLVTRVLDLLPETDRVAARRSEVAMLERNRGEFETFWRRLWGV